MEDLSTQTGRKRCVKTAVLNLLVLPIFPFLLKNGNTAPIMGVEISVVYDENADGSERGIFSFAATAACPARGSRCGGGAFVRKFFRTMRFSHTDAAVQSFSNRGLLILELICYNIMRLLYC